MDSVHLSFFLFQLKADDLLQHMEKISDILSCPWFAQSKFSPFRAKVGKLLKAFQQYHSFMVQQQKRTIAQQQSEEPLRSIKDSWIIKDLEGNPSMEIKPCYKSLHEDLLSRELYDPMSLLEYEPPETYVRRDWLEKMQFSFPVSLYAYRRGNFLRNLNFLWRIPEKKEDRSSLDVVRVVNLINEKIPVYGTRQMVKDLMLPYKESFGLKPAVLRNMIEYMRPNFNVPCDHASDSEVDNRLAAFILESDHTELAYDLRKYNGRMQNPDFDPFWEELHRYLEENASVHERRHGNAMYMPIAISVNDLIDIIKNRLPPDSVIPSPSIVRLQFWPSNPYNHSAIKYTGRFEVKYAVQQRQLRGEHEDSKYCAVQFNLLKAFAVRYHEYVHFLSEDDKAIIPIGQPGKPVTSVQRRHHSSLTTLTSGLQALDHDFHVCGCVPSVIFEIDVPENSKDSFYSGQPCVILKDKIFQPSSALRHAAETMKYLRGQYEHVPHLEAPSTTSTEGASINESTSVDQVGHNATSDDPSIRAAPSSDTEVGPDEEGEPLRLDATRPILIQYTDGGPDHRTTYKSVQLAQLCTFIALDLDLLVSARTAPSQSFRNPAERIMADLNLALQGTAFARIPMEPYLETKMKGLSTIKAVRRVAEGYPQLKDGLMNSVQFVTDTIKERFKRLKRNGIQFQTGEPATDCEVEILAESLQLFEDEISRQDIEKGVDMARWPRLQTFMDKHVQVGHYILQVLNFPIDKIQNNEQGRIQPNLSPCSILNRLYFTFYVNSCSCCCFLCIYLV